MFPWTSNSTCLASSPCTRLSRAPSTTSEVRLPPSHLSPSGLTIRLTYSVRYSRTKTAVDLPGAMTLPFLSMPCSQTPPESPTTIAFIGRLLLPSRFSTLSASGCSCHEAQSLHVCYDLDIALSTLNSCCCLHGAGISPAESAGLTRAHRKNLECRHQERSSPSSSGAHTTVHPAHHAGCAPGENHTRSR